MADRAADARGSMKFHARFPGSGPSGIALRVEAPPPSYEIETEGRTLAGNARRLGDGVWSLVTLDGRQAEARIERTPDGGMRVRIGAVTFEFDLLDELTARALLATGGRAVRKAKHVAAAMPGRVLRVLVAAGDAVSAGQPLIVLEAMKMENEVKSPQDGIVSGVAVAAGQPVNAGEVLVRFAADPA
ncbi:MAG TPA: biotin/lipoyl-containing protein [Thermoanaerobaculia bacterium]|nr:biotin/lipoyl-containing protein [Thermoanaerobaculia bacterium]